MTKLSKIIFILLLFILFVGIYAWRIEPRWVEWNYMDMPIENLPDSLVDKSLIHLTDLHLGENVSEEYIIQKFKEVERLNPDIVIYTGDFISITNKGQVPYKKLRKAFEHVAKGTIKTLAVLGNHDYGDDGNGQLADSVSHILSSFGVTVLRNDSLTVQGLCVIGIDDFWGTNFYPAEAMYKYRKEQPTLVLVHNPDVCDLDVWQGYNSWILSGHTHGGQVRLPFQKAQILPVKNKQYDEGLKHLSNGRTLYINKGLGHADRVRFNVRPEIAVFTLKRKG